MIYRRLHSSQATTPSQATAPSEATTPSEADISMVPCGIFIQKSQRQEMETMRRELFWPAYEEALAAESSGAGADYGPDGNYSHCNNADREGNAWRIYDHRTEGEFHINKRILIWLPVNQLITAHIGDAQGTERWKERSTVCLRPEDISHPDGKTGVVYRANNLVCDRGNG